MRSEGKKLAPSVIKATTPIRGTLAIETRPWRQLWQPHLPLEPTTLAQLKRDSALVLPALHHAHVRTLRDDAFVVVGVETVGEHHHELEWAQAWWCRRVG